MFLLTTLWVEMLCLCLRPSFAPRMVLPMEREPDLKIVTLTRQQRALYAIPKWLHLCGRRIWTGYLLLSKRVALTNTFITSETWITHIVMSNEIPGILFFFMHYRYYPKKLRGSTGRDTNTDLKLKMEHFYTVTLFWTTGIGLATMTAIWEIFGKH